jgi:Spy/CpxP family protein refolding chaperone
MARLSSPPKGSVYMLTARTVALAIALSCGPAAAVAFAQSPTAPGTRAAPPSATGAAGDRLPPRAPPEDIPSLTAAQREQLASLRRQARQQLAPQRAKLRAKRLELRALWLAEPPSEAAISKKLAEIDAIQAAMRSALVKSRLAHLALLTREQRLALWRPSPPHERPCCARHMRRMPDHEIAAPRGEELMPWLDAGDDLGVDGDDLLELDPMRCPPAEPGPPGSAKRDAR